MKICPTCNSQFDDDANFCPMDATRLPEPVAQAPTANATLVDFQPEKTLIGATSPAAPRPDATLSDRSSPVAGRFAPLDAGQAVPTGRLGPAEDVETGETVLLLVVDEGCVPTTAAGDRALRELKQLAKVKSDKVLRVVDQGRASDGRLYVASEAPAGQTLEELMADGPLPLGQAKAIVLAAGEALSESLKMGVIHRDLAPRHLYVGDSVKLTGFGVAEIVGDRVYGAPAFLSPEQAEGKPVDQRSNIYSLGALFYYMVTGEPPFSGDAAALVQQQLHAQPETPSRRNAALPAEADKVILKALEKSPGRRHLTLRQLLVEVDKIPAPAVALSATPARAAKGERDADFGKRTMMGMVMPRAEVVAPAASKPEAATASPGASEGSSPGQAAGLSGDSKSSSGSSGVSKSSSGSSPTPGSAMPTVVIEAEPTALTPAASAPDPGKGKEVPLAERPTMMSMPAVSFAATVPAAAGVESAGTNGAAPKSADAASPAKAAASMGRPSAAPVDEGGRQKRKSGKRRAFRETGWFKQGELEQEFNKHAASASDDPLAGPIAGPSVDDSALTSEDRARFSLRTGHTEMMPAIREDQIPGERMSEEEMLDEISSSRKTMVYAGAALGLLAILAAIYFVFLK